MFTHLHLHTEYSLLDGLIKVKPLVKKIKELGMTSCAITDHGVMYGLYEFWTECKANGIKPIIGCEVYVAKRSRFDKDPKKDKRRYHLTLLAKNEEGYHNLIRLCSLAHLEGFYTKPRVDKELLAKYSKGIIATTGCAASPVNRNLIHGKIKTAYKWARFFKENFEDFYVEIQRNGVKECEDAIPLMLQLAKELNLPLVATCDSHYLNKGEHNIQEINWCIRDAKLLTDNTRNKKWSEEFYIKSSEEMEELFKDIPEAIMNTQKIADSVELYSIKYDRVQPMFWNISENISTREILKELSYVGASKKYNTKYDHKNLVVCDEWIDINLNHSNELKKMQIIDENESSSFKIRKDIKQRLDYELEVIHNKGYDDYFLVVSDFLKWSKNNGIMCGVRGSVGGALTAFVTEITDIDPIRWELYFERFLNPERLSPPDIDCDIQDDRRHEVVEYLKMRYGENNCSLICALGRLKTRAAIRDVSRVMGIDLKIADKLSKMVVVKFGKPYSAAEMMQKVEEFKLEVNKDPKLVEMIEIVKKIENMPRQTGTHACGLLITPKPVIEYIPLQLDKEKRITCQIEMKPLEEMGLMKFDLLGLANLTIIKNTVNLVERYHKINIDPWKIPHNDPKTFDLLQKGDTDAVFQLESEGMKKYLRELKPTEVDDICFMCAAYRPGPMQFIQPYIDCKHGKKEPEYLIEELKPILSTTYGYAIYQEQVIRIAVEIAGYSMGQADMLRRAMGKKVKEIMEGERIKFIEGCKKNGYDEIIGNQLFDYLMPFADYGFNKSHSAGYAMLAYQTAYLKANYPIEFLAGLMQSDLLVPDKLKRDIEMAKSLNIEVLQPSINKSELLFTIDEGRVRFGLGGIKTISRKAVELLVEERKLNGNFKSIDDIVYRLGTTNLTKSNLETLIKCGVLDEFGNRAQLLSIIPDLYAKYTKNKTNTEQVDIFSTFFVEENTSNLLISNTQLPNIPDFDNKVKVAWENSFLGTYFSEHPLNLFGDFYKNGIVCKIEDVHSLKVGSKIRLLSILKSVKKIVTKKDGKPMAFVKLEDLSAEIEGVIFSSSYEKIVSKNNDFKTDSLYVITGKVSEKESIISIMVDDMVLVESTEDLVKFKPLNIENPQTEKKFQNSNTKIKIPNEKLNEESFVKHIKIDITGIKDMIILKRIKQILSMNYGEVSVTIKMNSEGKTIERLLSNKIPFDNSVQNLLESYIYN